jgi:hypothetical protein
VEISRFPRVLCPAGHQQERTAVRRAINGARPWFFCDQCGAEITTPKADEIKVATPERLGALREAEQVAVRRTAYEVALGWVKSFRRDRGDGFEKPSCFISYAWGDLSHERWVENLADNLQNADIAVILDRWHNPPGASVTRFIERIEAATFICPIGTQRYKQKDSSKTSDPVVQAELRLVKTRLRKRDEIHKTVVPLLREGNVPEEMFPALFEDSVYIDFRMDSRFLISLFELVLTLHRIPFETPLARRHRAEIARIG